MCLPRCLNFSILILIVILQFTLNECVRKMMLYIYTQTLKAMILRDTALFHGYLSHGASRLKDHEALVRPHAQQILLLVDFWRTRLVILRWN